MQENDILIRGFKLDYEDHDCKVIEGIDQIDIFALLNVTFIVISLITLITFFGTYIYELPSHHCPFCFLQSDYYYIGYIIYLTLFVGTFYGLSIGLIRESQRSYIISLMFNCTYVILLTSITILYYIKNGVWL